MHHEQTDQGIPRQDRREGRKEVPLYDLAGAAGQDASLKKEESQAEEWRQIRGYEGYYEASTRGRVRSIKRTIVTSNGIIKRMPGIILAPSTNAKGYRYLNLSIGGKVKTRRVHALIASTFLGDCRPGALEVDHINRTRHENAATNLRIVTRTVNRHNGGRYKTNKSGVRGVYYNNRRRKWHARFEAFGKIKHLGYFDDIEAAKSARCVAEAGFWKSQSPQPLTA